MFMGWLHRRRRRPPAEALAAFYAKYDNFQRLQESNAELLEIISEAEEKLTGDTVFGAGYLLRLATRTVFHSGRMVASLDRLSGGRYGALMAVWERLAADIGALLGVARTHREAPYILPFEQIRRDMSDIVGGKSANLGEIRCAVGLPVPAGFAITTAAFACFVSHNRLLETVHRLKMAMTDERPESLDGLSAQARALFMDAPMPPSLAAAIEAAFDAHFPPDDSGEAPAVALRSSAVGEDGETVSYAGQYLSLLGVRRENLMDGFRRVLASLFSPRAIAYRILKGIRVDDIAMGVTCQQMIAAAVSGILFTRDPTDRHGAAMVVNATWGLGAPVADGIVSTDTYWISDRPPHRVLDRRIVAKPRQLVYAPGGGLAQSAVPGPLQAAPCLDDGQLDTLAAYGQRLAAHFGTPQDVEWALDGAGRLVVLQSRPLSAVSARERGGAPAVPGYELLASGGDTACAGVGAGPLHVVRSDEDLNRFPEGGVLAAPHSSPRLVMVMHTAGAIIASAGSITGHMASLAREFDVPTLLNLPGAITVAPAGTVVTVDADNGRVYRGRVAPLIETARRRSHQMTGTQMYRWLQDLTDRIVPLNLTDPDSPGFSPAGCRTIHDVMRFVHEVGYREMFQISDLATDRAGLSVRLEAGLPLDLYVIDLGGGVVPATAGRRGITRAHVASAPLRALLDGMTCDALARRAPVPVTVGGFLSVMSRQMLSPPMRPEARFGEKSYAIISDRYLNFSSRVGYHFSVLDSFCGRKAERNYLNFEFKGGAADDTRRNRRARLIQRILSDLGFWTRVRGDRIQARFGKHPSERILGMLDQMGRLLMYTRQMDMLMNDEAAVERLAVCFLRGDYTLSAPGPAGAD